MSKRHELGSRDLRKATGKSCKRPSWHAGECMIEPTVEDLEEIGEIGWATSAVAV